MEDAVNSCWNYNFMISLRLNLGQPARYDLFDLYLEYTTCPYQTRKELKIYDKTFLNDYLQKRDLFFEHVNDSDTGKWVMKKTPLRIAKVNFDKNITFGELKQDINDLTSTATEIIDEWFQLKNQK